MNTNTTYLGETTEAVCHSFKPARLLNIYHLND
jgi:hypothetical protein